MALGGYENYDYECMVHIFLILVNISISWFVYYSNFFLGEGCGAGRVGWPLFRWALFPYNIAECFFLVTKYCVVYNCFNYGGLWR